MKVKIAQKKYSPAEYRQIRKDKFEKYIKAHAGKITAKEMAERLGCNKSVISNYASDVGISLVMPKIKEKKPWQIYVETNHKEFTVAEMAESQNVDRRKIYRYLVKNNLFCKQDPKLSVAKPRKSSSVPEGIFDETAHETWLI